MKKSFELIFEEFVDYFKNHNNNLTSEQFFKTIDFISAVKDHLQEIPTTKSFDDYICCVILCCKRTYGRGETAKECLLNFLKANAESPLFKFNDADVLELLTEAQFDFSRNASAEELADFIRCNATAYTKTQEPLDVLIKTFARLKISMERLFIDDEQKNRCLKVLQ